MIMIQKYVSLHNTDHEIVLVKTIPSTLICVNESTIIRDIRLPILTAVNFDPAKIQISGIFFHKYCLLFTVRTEPLDCLELLWNGFVSVIDWKIGHVWASRRDGLMSIVVQLLVLKG